MTGERLVWSSTAKENLDLTTGEGWGQGEPLYLRFSVHDTGPGLEAGELPRLFNRFSQANAKTHITYGGSGLGLYISRELVEKQGGRIGIASTPGIGTTIAFYIKTRRGEADMTANEENMHNPGLIFALPIVEMKMRTSNTDGTGSKRSLSATFTDSKENTFTKNGKLSLLLVEDNLVNQKVLQKQLEKSGYEVHVANHGVEALNFLRTTSAWASAASRPAVGIDIILMDWEMPIMDGLACSKNIRALERDGKIDHLPIIAITANARSEQIQTVLEAGIDDVMTKPFLVEELIAKMRKWTNKA